MKNEKETPVQRKFRDINFDMGHTPSPKRFKIQTKEQESPGTYLIYEKKRNQRKAEKNLSFGLKMIIKPRDLWFPSVWKSIEHSK
jgi:hypothetical protein